MKHIPAILFVLLMIVSCTSSLDLLENGEFEQAIDASIEKVEKNAGDKNELEVLKKAYNMANQLNRKQIENLELDKDPDNWSKISNLYIKLDQRQDKIRQLPSQIKEQFEFVDYDRAMSDAKYAAAEKLYNQGKELMAKGDKQEYRLAWAVFNRVKEIYPDFKDIEQKIQESRRLGITHAIFVVENNSGMEVPGNFIAQLSQNTSEYLNMNWLKLDTVENENTRYDHRIKLNLTNIILSPEKIDRQPNRVLKEIQDGYTQVRDSLGNVKRVSKMITVNATVLNVTKTKSAFLNGSLEIYEYSTDRILYNENLSEEIVFKNSFQEFYGDERALKGQRGRETFGLQQKRTDSKPRITINDTRGLVFEDRREVPFPTNEQLLLYSTGLLKEKTMSIIRSEWRLLES